MKKGDLVFHKDHNKPSKIISTGPINPKTGYSIYKNDIVWAYWVEYDTLGWLPMDEITVIRSGPFTDEEYSEIFV